MHTYDARLTSRLGSELGTVVTYDSRLADAARAAGLHVIAPA